MGQRDRTVIVHAYDDNSAPGGVGFGMSGYGVRQDEIKCDKDECKPKMKKSDHHKIVFELANRSSVDLRFPSDARRAMWVSADGQTCPKNPVHQDHIVRAQHVSPDQERLTVHNFNKEEDKGRYKFALNFEDADNPSGPLYSYDPIYDNQDGGRD